VVTGTSASIALASLIVGPASRTGGGSLTFDEQARDALRPSSRQARLTARDASDVLVALVASAPVVVDGVLNAIWYRDSPEVGKQLTLMYLETAAITAAIGGTVKAVVARERPYGRTCGDTLDAETYDCTTQGRYFSFFSGHSSAAFAAASVSCMNNRYLPLWGHGHRWLPCAVGYTLAAGTAALRVVADQHYVSDIAVGALTGTTVGLLVPWLHFKNGSSANAGLLGKHRLTLLPSTNGLVATGVF
jgi:membrane-associated phospholipid phosphatase